MEIDLLQPLIKELEKSGETRDLALARVLEATAKTSNTLAKVDSRLKVVEEQTIKTNGRVNKLDEKVEKIEDNCGSCPKSEIVKIIDDRKFFKRFFIYTGTAVSLIITVFGTIMWDKINYISDLNDDHIKIVVEKTLKELKIAK